MWSFRRPGGNGMELASSDAAAILFFLKKEKEKNGGAKSGPMSTRRGQAASVTLLRREQLRLASAPTRTPGRSTGLPHRCAHWFAMTLPF